LLTVKYSGLTTKKSKFENEKFKNTPERLAVVDKNLSFKLRNDKDKNEIIDFSELDRTVTASKSWRNNDFPVIFLDICKALDHLPKIGVTKFNRFTKGRCATNHSSK
jgi:hypothetical protein